MTNPRKTNKIKLLNINEEETHIFHPLLLIHGLIEYGDNTLTCDEYSCKQIMIKIKSNNLENDLKADIVDNQFKILIELNLNENEFEFKTRYLSKTLKLIYEPRKTNNIVLPLYVICNDEIGLFQAPNGERNTPESACKRINTACKLLQCFIAEKLNELELGRKTFETVSCEIFKSKLTFEEAKKMNQQEMWEYLGREIMNSNLGNNNVKYLAFLSFTRYNGQLYSEKLTTYEDFVSITSCYVALGGGGLAVFGTACLYTWPENIDEIMSRFKNEELIDRKLFLDDSCYRGTKGTCFSTTLGSALHELCHTFDLGHTSKGIMGRGFDDIEKTFIAFDDKINNKSVICKTSHTSIRNFKFSNGIKEKPITENEIYFTKSSAAFLCYHKWFNDYNINLNYSLLFDRQLKLIKSTIGIRVVEIRSKIDELVLYNWIFTGKILKYSFQIPELNLIDGFLVVVIDNVGNILKETYFIETTC